MPPQVVLTSSGSEVQLAVEAQQLLRGNGIAARVVSLPCWEQFEAQSTSYRQEVFPSGVPVVAIEAASSFGWHRYADRVVAIDHFGASAPYRDRLRKVRNHGGGGGRRRPRIGEVAPITTSSNRKERKGRQEMQKPLRSLRPLRFQVLCFVGIRTCNARCK